MTDGRPAGASREARRARLARTRLLLIFTPSLTGARPPLDALVSALPWLGAVQIRVPAATPGGCAPARETLTWTQRVLELLAGRNERPLVFVNDRVDVARALAADGVDGVHVGTEDAPPELAREVLGPDALIGVSTHGAADVARAAASADVDLLGFGPVHPTRTKGYTRGLGAEAAWVAASATELPVFPIGGIDATNAGELAGVGRAAVGSAILAAEDPGRAARELYELLGDPASARPW